LIIHFKLFSKEFPVTTRTEQLYHKVRQQKQTFSTKMMNSVYKEQQDYGAVQDQQPTTAAVTPMTAQTIQANGTGNTSGDIASMQAAVILEGKQKDINSMRLQGYIATGVGLFTFAIFLAYLNVAVSISNRKMELDRIDRNIELIGNLWEIFVLAGPLCFVITIVMAIVTWKSKGKIETLEKEIFGQQTSLQEAEAIVKETALNSCFWVAVAVSSVVGMCISVFFYTFRDSDRIFHTSRLSTKQNDYYRGEFGYGDDDFTKHFAPIVFFVCVVYLSVSFYMMEWFIGNKVEQAKRNRDIVALGVGAQGTQAIQVQNTAVQMEV